LKREKINFGYQFRKRQSKARQENEIFNLIGQLNDKGFKEIKK